MNYPNEYTLSSNWQIEQVETDEYEGNLLKMHGIIKYQVVLSMFEHDGLGYPHPIELDSSEVERFQQLVDDIINNHLGD